MERVLLAAHCFRAVSLTGSVHMAQALSGFWKTLLSSPACLGVKGLPVVASPQMSGPPCLLP